jgi:hypothetical protein
MEQEVTLTNGELEKKETIEAVVKLMTARDLIICKSILSQATILAHHFDKLQEVVNIMTA